MAKIAIPSTGQAIVAPKTDLADFYSGNKSFATILFVI